MSRQLTELDELLILENEDLMLVVENGVAKKMAAGAIPTYLSGTFISTINGQSGETITLTADNIPPTFARAWWTPTLQSDLDGKQDISVYDPQSISADSFDRANHTGVQEISTITNLQLTLDGKQETLVSGTNIKTINGDTLLGSGDLVLSSGDMLSSVYDPQNIAADAFDRTNHIGTQAISTIDGLQTVLDSKQETLVSGTNIKTINSQSLLGAGDLVISGGGSAIPISADTSISAGNSYIVKGTYTLTVPTATTNTDSTIIINKYVGTAPVLTIDGVEEFITSKGIGTPVTLTEDFITYKLISNGTNWEINI